MIRYRSALREWIFNDLSVRFYTRMIQTISRCNTPGSEGFFMYGADFRDLTYVAREYYYYE